MELTSSYRLGREALARPIQIKNACPASEGEKNGYTAGAGGGFFSSSAFFRLIGPCVRVGRAAQASHQSRISHRSHVGRRAAPRGVRVRAVSLSGDRNSVPSATAYGGCMGYGPNGNSDHRMAVIRFWFMKLINSRSVALCAVAPGPLRPGLRDSLSPARCRGLAEAGPASRASPHSHRTGL